MRALTEEEVKDKVHEINKNITVLSIDRKNGKTKILCKCNIDGHEWKTTIGNLYKKQGCPKCSNNARLTNEDIIKFLEINRKDLKVINPDYINSKSKLQFECNMCGHKWITVYKSVKDGSGCPKCADKSRNLNRIITGYEIINNSKLINDKIILNIENLEEKIKVHTPIKCECAECGHEWKISYNNLRKGRGCPKCKIERLSGDTAPNWNPNLTEEDRINGRNVFKDGINLNVKWRAEVYERDSYTCVISGKNGNIEAHHINGYNWDVKNRFNIDNGITLSKDIHILFHKTYGYGNNTKEQFEEFVSRYKSGEIVE